MSPDVAPLVMKSRPRLLRRLLAAAALFGVVFLAIREQRSNRAEIEILNNAEVDVSVKCEGFYPAAQAVILPGQTWHTRFRYGDSLIMQATFAGLTLSKKVTLFDAEHGSRVHGEVSTVAGRAKIG